MNKRKILLEEIGDILLVYPIQSILVEAKIFIEDKQRTCNIASIFENLKFLVALQD